MVVYLWIPQDIRLERLRQLENERYGDRIMPGGNMYDQSQAFLDWVSSYDDGVNRRSRQLHEEWLSTLSCPVVRIEGEYSIEEQLDVLMAEIQP